MSAQPIEQDVHLPLLVELTRLVKLDLTDDEGARPWRASDGDEKCQECRHVNPCWWAPNDLWNAVMIAEREAVLCPSCFIRKAERHGVGSQGAWQLYPSSSLF